MSLRAAEVSRLFEERDQLTAERAAELLCNPAVLNHSNGRRFAGFLIAHRLGPQSAWNLIKTAVVERSSSNVRPLAYFLLLTSRSNCRKELQTIGAAINSAFRQASTVRSSVSLCKADVEAELFAPLLQDAILCQRKHAEKFQAILRAAIGDRQTDISEMLFRVSKPVVWRYLTAPNAVVRLSAFRVQAAVFPPKTRVRTVCLHGIGATMHVISVWWAEMPAASLDDLLAALLELSRDENAEIRAAVLKHSQQFAENAEAANRLAAVFRRICRRGVDDVDERVRLRAVELLNCFQSHGTFKMSTLVSTSDLLDRLAFEEDEAVGSRLSEFLFHFFFDSCVSNVVRCNAVLHLCRQNREAALNLHRRLVDFLPLDEISLHLNAILNLATCVLKEIGERGIDQEAGGHVGLSSKSNGVHPTKADSFVQCGMEPEAEEEDEELQWSSVANAFQKVKDILDCSLVAYVCLYETAMESKESATLSALCQRFLQVVNWAVDRYEDLDESFMKTVFTIASLVKVKGMVSSRIQTTAERLLRAGDVNEQFLLIFGSHDMSGLLQLLEEGLDQLLESSTKFEKIHSTAAAKRKRVRGFADETAVVDALDLVLASPVCRQQIRAEFLPFVEKFANKTERIRDNFMLRFRKDFDIDKPLFLRVHETFNVLNILRFVEHEKTAGTSNGHSLSPIRKRKHSAISRWPFTLRKDPLVAECEWFQRHFEAKPEICEDLPFMEKVLTTLGRHLRAYKHTKGAVDQANRLLDVIEDEFMKIRLEIVAQDGRRMSSPRGARGRVRRGGRGGGGRPERLPPRPERATQTRQTERTRESRPPFARALIPRPPQHSTLLKTAIRSLTHEILTRSDPPHRTECL
ncbi:hypothetical protein M3Y99_01586000 [Aphelenchoides fujianensis]|nr:hypothetical protein M3Y99_01586000 [Aphelenchoides fujianensis]